MEIFSFLSKWSLYKISTILLLVGLGFRRDGVSNTGNLFGNDHE